VIETPDAEIDAARRSATRACEVLRQVGESLGRFDHATPNDEQSLHLAAAVEALRAARGEIDAACLQLAEAVLRRGESPHLLGWSDGTPD
jgi:hypothetical protein